MSTEISIAIGLQQADEELRDGLQEATTATEPIHRALKQQRGVINDIHCGLAAVSKGLEKRRSQTPLNQWPDLPDPAVPQGILKETDP